MGRNNNASRGTAAQPIQTTITISKKNPEKKTEQEREGKKVMKVPSTGRAHVIRFPGSSVEKSVSYGCFLYAASISLPRRNSAALHGEGATPTSGVKLEKTPGGATLGTPPPNPVVSPGGIHRQHSFPVQQPCRLLQPRLLAPLCALVLNLGKSKCRPLVEDRKGRLLQNPGAVGVWCIPFCCRREETRQEERKMAAGVINQEGAPGPVVFVASNRET